MIQSACGGEQMKVITKQVEDKPLTITVEYPKMDERAANIIRKIKAFDITIRGSQAGETFSLSISDIYYIEAVERKTFLYTKDEIYLTSKKLYELEELLEGTSIIRISKSCLMNMDMLYSIKQLLNSQLEATLCNGEKLVVGRTYLKNIKNRVKKEG